MKPPPPREAWVPLIATLLAGLAALWLLGQPANDPRIALAGARRQLAGAATLVREPERMALAVERRGQFDFEFNLNYRDLAGFAARRHLHPGGLAAEFTPSPEAAVGEQRLRLLWWVAPGDTLRALPAYPGAGARGAAGGGPGGAGGGVRLIRVTGGLALSASFQGAYGARTSVAAWQALLELARARHLHPGGAFRREYFDNPLFRPTPWLRSRMVLPLAAADTLETHARQTKSPS